jgi:predicted DNA-binding transcriptional regulator AlpA
MSKRYRRQVPIKDFYTAEDVASLLGIGHTTVYELAHRRSDPMPFRLLYTSSRGMFVEREELFVWLERNTDYVAELMKKDKEHGPKQ